jgi:VCBS repeat-containing protein
VINDAIVEADETVVVTMNTITSGDTDISIDTANNSDAIEILDNDSATVSISATNDGNEAGAVTGVFTVTQSAVSSTDTVISYSVTGTATSDSDFTPLSGTVTILAGDTTATITVPVINDAIVEADETVVVTMNTITSGDTDISIDTANNSDAIEILNDDTANLTIANVSQNEGTGGTTTSFNFSVTLEQDVQGGFDIAYNTNEGSATFANNDFIDNDGTLSFAGNAGEVQTITVLVNHDGFDESNETFTVSLGALSSIGVDPANILILGSPATGTIINDDNTPIPDAGGPYVIDEGSDLTLDATGSSDLDGDILTFRWDVDGDGDFDENITGATPTVTWNELVALGIDNGPYSGTIIVEVSDGFNTDTDTTTLNVLNVAPEANDDDFIMELNEANGDERDVRITGNLFLDNGNGIDFDINDAIEVVEGSRTINTTYGIVFIEANGDFIYTPTNPPDIVNTENNTFTDSFIYTIQDSDGATDTATVEITVVDLGIQTNTDTDTLNNGQGIIIELSTENETANSELNGQPNNDTTFVRGLIIPEIKILYAIDISESSLELIDTNGDGIKDITRLEAEIQAMKEFTQYLSAKSEILSRTNVTISVVTYSDGTFDVANTDDIVRETVEEFVIDPTSNSLLIVQNYLDDILELGAERINPWVSLLSAYGLDPSDFGITTDGLSNPDAALDEAVSFFSGDTTSAKLMLFAGAGTPNVSGDDDGEGIAGEFLWRKNYNSRALQFDTELDFLDDVEIIGVNFGNSGYLDEIDSDSSAETYDSLLGIIEDLEAQDPQDVFPIVGSQLTDFKLILNGQFDNDGDLIIGTGTDVNDILGAVIADPSGDGAISIDDVKRTPLGYSFDGIIIGGLDGSSGADNYLTAVAFFDDGTVDVTNNIIGYTPVTNGLT